MTWVTLELERVPDPAQRPGPEEKLVVNSPIPNNISAKPASFIAGSTGLEIMLNILGSSKARRFLRARKARANLSHYSKQARNGSLPEKFELVPALVTLQASVFSIFKWCSINSQQRDIVGSDKRHDGIRTYFPCWLHFPHSFPAPKLGPIFLLLRKLKSHYAVDEWAATSKAGMSIR